MKYPQKQYSVLTESLKKLAVHIDIKGINPHTLHYIIFQQYSEGQKHNWLYCVPGGELKKAYTIPDMTYCKKFFPENCEFELYPIGCNDTHIETAMKTAIKEIYNTIPV